MTRKIIQIGSSIGITLPRRVLKRLGLSVGNEVDLDIDENEGKVIIQSADRISNRDREVAEMTHTFIDRYKDDLEALAEK